MRRSGCVLAGSATQSPLSGLSICAVGFAHQGLHTRFVWNELTRPMHFLAPARLALAWSQRLRVCRRQMRPVEHARTLLVELAPRHCGMQRPAAHEAGAAKDQSPAPLHKGCERHVARRAPTLGLKHPQKRFVPRSRVPPDRAASDHEMRVRDGEPKLAAAACSRGQAAGVACAEEAVHLAEAAQRAPLAVLLDGPERSAGQMGKRRAIEQQ